MAIDERFQVVRGRPRAPHYFGLGEAGLRLFSPLNVQAAAESVEAPQISLGYATEEDFAHVTSELGYPTADVRLMNVLLRMCSSIKGLRDLAEATGYSSPYLEKLEAFEAADNIADFDPEKSGVILIDGSLYEVVRYTDDSDRSFLTVQYNLDTLDIYLKKTDQRDRRGIGIRGETVLRELIADASSEVERRKTPPPAEEFPPEYYG